MKILIYGYGIEGKSTENYLKSCTSNNDDLDSIRIYDESQSECSQPPSRAEIDELDMIIPSAGISWSKAMDKLSVDESKLTSHTNIFFDSLDEDLRSKIIGITGTKGKSTTTEFCYHALKKAGKKVAKAGNIGLPLLDYRDQLQDLDYLVCELSSYQLEYLDRVKKSPKYTLFTSWYSDHLDRHGSMKEYLNAKSNIWKYQNESDYLLLPESVEIEPKTRATIKKCGPNLPVNNLSKDIFNADHFRSNFGLVSELFKVLDIEQEYITEAIKEFQGLEHRMEQFLTIDTKTFVNDAIATTPESTISAIDYYGGQIGTLLLGGHNRDYNFGELVKKISSIDCDIFILNSTAGSAIAKELTKSGIGYKMFNTFAESISDIIESTPEGKICLMSMAAPSYNHSEYANFVQKGELFKQLVKEYYDQRD